MRPGLTLEHSRLMAYLHCGTRSRILIWVRISVPTMGTVMINNIWLRIRVWVHAVGTCSVQYNVAIGFRVRVCAMGTVYAQYNTWGLESESKLVSESVSGNVNTPQFCKNDNGHNSYTSSAFGYLSARFRLRDLQPWFYFDKLLTWHIHHYTAALQVA